MAINPISRKNIVNGEQPKTNGKHYICDECGTEIQGNSELCVSCFRKYHKPCPQCMVHANNGSWRCRRKPRRGGPIDCSYCNNERWLIIR